MGKTLSDVMTPDERRRVKVTTAFIEAYKPFTCAARGKIYALVFMVANGLIYWALTTRNIGRINLAPDPDAVGELQLFMRVVNVLLTDPLYRNLPDLTELRS